MESTLAKPKEFFFKLFIFKRMNTRVTGIPGFTNLKGLVETFASLMARVENRTVVSFPEKS